MNGQPETETHDREPERIRPGEELLSPEVTETLRALEREEPLSLAEEIAAEGSAGSRGNRTPSTSRSSSRATPTSPSCNGCRWPN